MILYKSVTAVKEYRQYMKDRMKKARDSSSVKAKVSTVNTLYSGNKAAQQRANSTKKNSSISRSTTNLLHNALDTSK